MHATIPREGMQTAGQVSLTGMLPAAAARSHPCSNFSRCLVTASSSCNQWRAFLCAHFHDAAFQLAVHLPSMVLQVSALHSETSCR